MTTKKQAVKYVDGFVFSIAKENLAAYKKMAKEAEQVWKKFGALDYKECMGDDLDIKAQGGMPVPLSFNKLAKPAVNEVVWFSYVTYKSKAHRNQVNKKVHEYFGKKYADTKDVPMPFDMKKMAYGGFSVMVG